MPGVADHVNRTTLKQQHSQRKKERDEILQLVKENRLHEADERQLEILKLATELNSLMTTIKQSKDHESIGELVKNAISEAIKNIPAGVTAPVTNSQEINLRPSMKHVSLSDIQQTSGDVSISHIEIKETSTAEEDATSKLEQLKRIKGNG